MSSPLILFVVVAIIQIDMIHSCLLAGVNSGECRTYEENELYMPFCAAQGIKYTACVPLTVQTPGGDWDNHTLPTKDKWVEQTSYDMIFERIRHEMNETLDDLEVNEFGEEGLMTKRFWNQNVQDPRGRLYKAKQWGGTRITDCETSFIKYMCYMNFPRCDTEGRSLILCRSVCENYLNACGYQKDLWRCGDPRFLGAEKPEVPAQDDDSGEYTITWRAPFPGAPFRDNEFNFDSYDGNGDPEPVIVCTPSVNNLGSQKRMSLIVICMTALIISVFIL